MPRKKIVFPTKPRRVRRSTKQGKLRLKELREKRRDRAQWQSKVDISRHHKAGTPINVSNVNGALEYVPRIAIIGGGAGGLVSLRYCLAAGLNATLFEQSEGIGGVWRYDKNISNNFVKKSSMDKVNNNNKDQILPVLSPLHKSPMYEALITNLPKEIMAFFDFPFKSDLPSFITHEDMLSYLYEYAYHNHLMEHIQCSKRLLRMWQQEKTEADTINRKKDSSVVNNGMEEATDDNVNELPIIKVDAQKWMLEFDGHDNKYGYTTTHNFDAVIIANGHYNRPYMPQINGSNTFPGRILHSIDFQHGKDFENKIVLILGAKASGTDIALQIKKYAVKVYVCDKYFNEDDQVKFKELHSHENVSNIFWHSNVDRFNIDGSVDTVQGNHIENVDVVIYCTGYQYDFPFLINEDFQEGKTIVHKSGRRVNNLYKQCIYKKIPSLAFVGLPYSVIPFQLVELQARLISSFFAGEIELTLDERMEEGYDDDDENVSNAHFLGPQQWEYCKDLIELVNPAVNLIDGDYDGNKYEDVISGVNERVVHSKMTISSDIEKEKQSDEVTFIPYNIPSKEELMSTIGMNHEIWQHVSSNRPKHVGGDATYRNIFYNIKEIVDKDDALQKSWNILNDKESKERKIELKEYYDKLEKKKIVETTGYNVELNHLKKMKNLLSKMKNIESQLPTIPTTKQWDECLIGIERCALWWRELIPSVDDPKMLKNYSTQLWMLIQHAMQSGPLINSKPAYFKRTDYIYIKRSYEFLSYIHKIGELGFTDTQKKRLEKFINNCEKSMQKANTDNDSVNEMGMNINLNEKISNVGNKKKMKKDGKKKKKKKGNYSKKKGKNKL